MINDTRSGIFVPCKINRWIIKHVNISPCHKIAFSTGSLQFGGAPRLVRILEKGLQGPLTLISAPAGSGKTTLMGEWRVHSDRKTPIAWLSLDAADNDPFRFLTYLTASIESVSKSQ